MLSAQQGKQAVRIPLDYYRILGSPLAATEEQLRQAYSDRRQQLPRREYSQAAITSRKQLIEEAYVVLSDPKERRAYDHLYLAHAYDPQNALNRLASDSEQFTDPETDSKTLSIEIAQEQFVGGLLLLQELGEYEQVIKLGRPYLVNKNNPTVVTTSDTEGTIPPERPDVVLTVALACLELGREQWQQGHYENAAISLETGEELLSREKLFPSVTAEIQSDLYKLRPYRILELLSQGDEQGNERRQGLQLLQAILEERGGIEGTGNDQSGLSIDDFLRFIQQLRNHLTVAEQHKLFEAESKRPSAVATYLAVYALIARGFTQRQPALIRQAKQMLIRLGKRQDVHLEQSLCALLLGQTEEATRALELSQEYEALAFIREKSQDSPDLLPGLCLYGERWLQNEVFPHFRDLTGQASLKEYFADTEVQAYLESLPTVDSIESSRQRPSNSVALETPANVKAREVQREPIPKNYEYPHSRSHTSSSKNESAHNAREVLVTSPPPVSGGNSYNSNGRTTLKNGVQKRRRSTPTGRPVQVIDHRHETHRRRRTGRPQAKIRLLWTVFGSLAAILVLWLLLSTTFGFLKNVFTPAVTSKGEQPAVSINQPVVTIPEPNSQPQFPEGVLTEAIAEEVIQVWLSTKAAALGPNHDIDSLNQILHGSTLSNWVSIAKQTKAVNRYRKYEHAFEIESVDTSQNDPNNAAVEATVSEVTQYYDNGQLRKSGNDKVRVKYELVRLDGGWRIREMSVLNKISMIF
jgi:hypothetical protein